MKNEINIEDIKNLLTPKKSKELFFEAILEILPKKNGFKIFIFIFFLSILPTILIAQSSETIILFLNAVKTINNVSLAVLGIIFTGYVFFQALLNDESLVRLSSAYSNTKKNNKSSDLKESNEYFIKIILLYGVLIVLNIFLILVLGSLKSSFSFKYFSTTTNNVISGVFIFMYFSFSFLIIFEFKSFIFNLFQLFNLHAGERVIKYIKKE